MLLGATKGYARILRKVIMREVDRNRQGASSQTHRRYKRLVGPSNWFKVT